MRYSQLKVHHRWCTCREFSKKFRNDLDTIFRGLGGKMIHDKKTSKKSRDSVPLNPVNSLLFTPFFVSGKLFNALFFPCSGIPAGVPPASREPADGRRFCQKDSLPECGAEPGSPAAGAGTPPCRTPRVINRREGATVCFGQ